MEFFGVGGVELIAIFIIMLVVAGPKRMIQWAYVLGQYVSKIRQYWGELTATLQEELNQAGIDVKLPEEPPTRQYLNQQARKLLEPVIQPIQQAAKEVDAEMKQAVSIPSDESQPTKDNYGMWSGQSDT